MKILAILSILSIVSIVTILTIGSALTTLAQEKDEREPVGTVIDDGKVFVHYNDGTIAEVDSEEGITINIDSGSTDFGDMVADTPPISEESAVAALEEPTTWSTIGVAILAIIFKMVDGNKIKSIGRKADRSRAGNQFMCDIFSSYDDIVQKFVAASADGTVEEKEWKGILTIVQDKAPKLKAQFDGIRTAMEIDDRVH